MNLLVVDDDRNYRNVLSEVLALRGHLVHTAADGAEAYQVILTGNIQLVVADVKMPRVGAAELHALLRFDPKFRELPFVYISGYTDALLSDMIKNPDVDFFLSKKTEIHLLVDLVNRQAEKLATTPTIQTGRSVGSSMFPLLDL